MTHRMSGENPEELINRYQIADEIVQTISYQVPDETRRAEVREGAAYTEQIFRLHSIESLTREQTNRLIRHIAVWFNRPLEPGQRVNWAPGVWRPIEEFFRSEGIMGARRFSNFSAPTTAPTAPVGPRVTEANTRAPADFLAIQRNLRRQAAEDRGEALSTGSSASSSTTTTTTSGATSSTTTTTTTAISSTTTSSATGAASSSTTATTRPAVAARPTVTRSVPVTIAGARAGATARVSFLGGPPPADPNPATRIPGPLAPIAEANEEGSPPYSTAKAVEDASSSPRPGKK